MSWRVYAILSAFFGALVAILGKIGVRGVDSNLAVAVRTVVLVFFAWGIVMAQGNADEVFHIPKHSMIFLFLSAIATGLSWLFYYKALQIGEASRVAPIDKFSVALAPTRKLHHGIIVLVRRRTRAAERAPLFRLLERAGESGVRNNINFA